MRSVRRETQLMSSDRACNVKTDSCPFTSNNSKDDFITCTSRHLFARRAARLEIRVDEAVQLELGQPAAGAICRQTSVRHPNFSATPSPQPHLSNKNMADKPKDVVLYGYFRSGSSWRVRAALTHKGINYETKTVDLVKGAQVSLAFLPILPIPTLLNNPQITCIAFQFIQLISPHSRLSVHSETKTTKSSTRTPWSPPSSATA